MLQYHYKHISRSIAIGSKIQATELDSTIPQGIDNGAKLRLSGQRPSTYSRHTASDLIVRIIDIMPEKDWGRDRKDLFKREEVDVLDLITGCSVTITHLDGKHYELKNTAGCKEWTKIENEWIGYD